MDLFSEHWQNTQVDQNEFVIVTRQVHLQHLTKSPWVWDRLDQMLKLRGLTMALCFVRAWNIPRKQKHLHKRPLT